MAVTADQPRADGAEPAMKMPPSSRPPVLWGRPIPELAKPRNAPVVRAARDQRCRHGPGRGPGDPVQTHRAPRKRFICSVVSREPEASAENHCDCW